MIEGSRSPGATSAAPCKLLRASQGEPFRAGGPAVLVGRLALLRPKDREKHDGIIPESIGGIVPEV
jgi:hypothetical protein